MFVQRKRPVPDHPAGGERGGAHRDWHRPRNLPEKHSKRCVSRSSPALQIVKLLLLLCTAVQPGIEIRYINNTISPLEVVPYEGSSSTMLKGALAAF